MTSNPIFRPPWLGYLKGLIYYINVINYSQLHDIVQVTPSSTEIGWDSADSIVDFFEPHDEAQDQTDGNWASNNITNSSLTITFPYHHISATHYTFRTRGTSILNTPQQWIVEGSNDGESWKLLHRQTYTTYFQTISNMKTFQMDFNGVFSMFKITQIGLNSNQTYHLHISRFELFGSISEKDQRCFIPLFQQRTSFVPFRHISLSLLYIYLCLSK